MVKQEREGEKNNGINVSGLWGPLYKGVKISKNEKFESCYF